MTTLLLLILGIAVGVAAGFYIGRGNRTRAITKATTAIRPVVNAGWRLVNTDPLSPGFAAERTNLRYALEFYDDERREALTSD